MSSSRDNRQRAAARVRLERQMAERREALRRRRQLQARIAGGVAGVVLLGAAIWVIVAVNSGGGGPSTPGAQGCAYPEAFPQPTPTPATDPSASADPSATVDPSATADPSATVDPSASPTPSLPPGIEDVGFPSTDPPHSGFQVLTFETNLGTIQVEMDLSKTPCTANSLAFLAGKGFYDDTTCHRIVPSIFALQCGDPTGTSQGGPNYTVADENLPTDRRPAYHEGDVAMANAGPDTNGSQFFFVYGTTPLDFPANYPLWGKVISGFEIIQQVAGGGINPATDTGSGDGIPSVALTFTKVTAGPVTATAAPSPSYSTMPTPTPTSTETPTPTPTVS